MSRKVAKTTTADTSADAAVKNQHKQQLQEQIRGLEELRCQSSELNVLIADGLFSCRRDTKDKLREFLRTNSKQVLDRPLQPLKLNLEKPTNPTDELKTQREFERKTKEFKTKTHKMRKNLEKLEEEKRFMLEILNSRMS